MSKLDFKLIGAKQLNEALKNIPIKFEKQIAKGAIRAGASVILKEAKANVPVRGGTLKRSLQVVARKNKGGYKGARVSVIARKGKKFQARRMDAWYSHIVEFGSRFRPANPFMRRAFDSQSTNAIKAVSIYIQKRIEKLAKSVR